MVHRKLHELTEEELAQVSGGRDPALIIMPGHVVSGIETVVLEPDDTGSKARVGQ